jgi:hypothetical protein
MQVLHFVMQLQDHNTFLTAMQDQHKLIPDHLSSQQDQQDKMDRQ